MQTNHTTCSTLNFSEPHLLSLVITIAQHHGVPISLRDHDGAQQAQDKEDEIALNWTVIFAKHQVSLLKKAQIAMGHGKIKIRRTRTRRTVWKSLPSVESVCRRRSARSACSSTLRWPYHLLQHRQAIQVLDSKDHVSSLHPLYVSMALFSLEIANMESVACF